MARTSPPDSEGHGRTESAIEIARRLAEYFPESQLKFRPLTVSKDGKTALPSVFVNAEDIQDRLDDVVGVENWKDSYQPIGTGAVICKLKVKIDGRWVTKEGVGASSAAVKDGGSSEKNAFSDALKRAAAKFGIGRYLKRVKFRYQPLDQWKKFVNPPRMPAEFLPRRPGDKANSRPTQSPPPPSRTAPEDAPPNVAASGHAASSGASSTPPTGEKPFVRNAEWLRKRARENEVDLKCPEDLLWTFWKIRLTRGEGKSGKKWSFADSPDWVMSEECYRDAGILLKEFREAWKERQRQVEAKLFATSEQHGELDHLLKQIQDAGEDPVKEWWYARRDAAFFVTEDRKGMLADEAFNLIVRLQQRLEEI